MDTFLYMNLPLTRKAEGEKYRKAITYTKRILFSL